MRCPICGSSRYENSGTGYKCLACGAVFHEGEESKKPSLSSLYTTGARPSNYKTESAGEQIYKSCIVGSCEIICAVGNTVYSGSGFLLNSSGYVITNSHVILDEYGHVLPSIVVKVNNQKVHAMVIKSGTPDTIDVALLKLDFVPQGAIPVKIGQSSKVNIGETVYAIGNSLGEGLCITRGIISDKNRQVADSLCFMSDVAVNHGNSGGPLFNEDAEVIAICVAGIDSAKGMNYFIPIDQIRTFLKDKIMF